MGNWDQWVRQSLFPMATVILTYELIKSVLRGLSRSRTETRQREDRFKDSSAPNQLSTSQVDARIDARMNSILDAKIDARIGFLLGSPVLGQVGSPMSEHKTTFTVVLKDAGANKINTIKAVREVTSLGLKDAKDLVDTAPKPLKMNISREDAAAVARKFEGVAAVEIV
jgi:large subunit ribosomal protein L7/L12